MMCRKQKDMVLNQRLAFAIHFINFNLKSSALFRPA